MYYNDITLSDETITNISLKLKENVTNEQNVEHIYSFSV